MKKLVLLFLASSFGFCSNVSTYEEAKNFIEDGIKNYYFPKFLIQESAPNILNEVIIYNKDIIRWNENSMCDQHKNETIIIDQNTQNSVNCDGYSDLYILTDGNNTIMDSYGNDIFFMGGKNDYIKKTRQGNVFVFEKGWGHDKLELGNTPMFSRYSIKNYDGSYPYQFLDFIVFGEGIKREDLAWNGDTLVNLKTRDTIEFVNFNKEYGDLYMKPINFIFKDEKEQLRKDMNFIQNLDSFSDANLSTLNMKDFIDEGEFSYILSGDSQIKKIKVLSENSADVLGSISVKTQIEKFDIGKNFIFIGVTDLNYSFIYIYDKKTLKPLNRTIIDGHIAGMKVDKDMLYVLQSENSIDNTLLTYKIKGDNIELTNKTPFYDIMRFNIAGDLLFAFYISGQVGVYDLKSAQIINARQKLDDEVIAVKKYKNFYALNFEGSLFGIYEFEGKELKEICKVNLGENGRGGYGNSLFVEGDNIFVNKSEEGIFILNECKIKENLKTGGKASTMFHKDGKFFMDEIEQVFKSYKK